MYCKQNTTKYVLYNLVMLVCTYRFTSGGENIPNAINSVKKEQFVQSRGDRPTVENVLVLITDAYQTGADTAITVWFYLHILFVILEYS